MNKQITELDGQDINALINTINSKKYKINIDL
jgi:hypothetical protein